jgi:hypothetical protein
VLVEVAWAYQHRPNVTGFLLRRQKDLGTERRKQADRLEGATAITQVVQGDAGAREKQESDCNDVTEKYPDLT